MNASDFLTGCNILTVSPSETWLRTRELLGDAWHAEYRYKLTNVNSSEGGTFLFLHAWTVDRKGGGRWVYVGSVNRKTGVVSLTSKSAFPATATRVRVADRVLRTVFAGHCEKFTAVGWAVEVAAEEKELVCPF